MLLIKIYAVAKDPCWGIRQCETGIISSNVHMNYKSKNALGNYSVLFTFKIKA